MIERIFLALTGFLATTGAAFAGAPVNVPEPAALSVLAVGAGALLLARMRRKK